MNRREWLRRVAAGGIAWNPLSLSLAAAFGNDEDELICRNKFSLAASLSLQTRPISEVIIQMGISFLGTPYVAKVLEVPGPERLIVNMRGLDCVSLYENALTLARCIKKNSLTFEDYRRELTFIRYRGGIVEGYPSRLHYTSDYFYDNEKKGVWRDITRDLSGVLSTKPLNFMSQHPELYRQIGEDPGVLDAIRQQEVEITARERFLIRKEDLRNVEDQIMGGDIVGITTDIDGLDVSHTGIALRQHGRVHLLHAPTVGKHVEISGVPLADILMGNKRHTGLMIARPLEPAEG